jgi:hypothetical protein
MSIFPFLEFNPLYSPHSISLYDLLITSIVKSQQKPKEKR